MNLSVIFKKWCADNHRALVTPAEGAAVDEFKRVRNNYSLDPTDANRVALDTVQAEWLITDRANCTQRGLISISLFGVATKGIKAVCPAIMRRAANALAWLATEQAFAEKERCELFGHPFSETAIVRALVMQATSFRYQATRIETEQFQFNSGPHQLAGMEWLPDLLQTKGDVWDCDTLDPLQKNRDSKKWRNIGQCGNDLFDPLLFEMGDTAATAIKGKGIVKYENTPPAKGVEMKSTNLDDPAVKAALAAQQPEAVAV